MLVRLEDVIAIIDRYGAAGNTLPLPVKIKEEILKLTTWEVAAIPSSVSANLETSGVIDIQ